MRPPVRPCLLPLSTPPQRTSFNTETGGVTQRGKSLSGAGARGGSHWARGGRGICYEGPTAA
jgi:hypothetical protein